MTTSGRTPIASGENSGRRTREEATEDITVATRQLARRQEKWFRRDPRIHGLAPGPRADVLAAALRTQGP